MLTAKSRRSLSAHSIAECQVLILAGGRGTRLRSSFRTGPKSMAPVGKRPFLAYLLRWLHDAGLRDVIVCVGYKKAQIQSWLGDGHNWGLRVKYSEEKKLLGTAGALKRAGKLVSSPLCLVVNGDSFLDANLRAMFRFHRQRRALATIALARVPDSTRYGAVTLDRSRRIIAFQEKEKNLPEKIDRASPRRFQLINGGVYLLKKQVLAAIPPRRAVSLEKEIFPGIAGHRLYGFVTQGYFIDIGVPADFARAQTELPRRLRA